MRKLIVTEFMTLDGVVEAPGGEATHPHAGWTMPYGVPELYAEKLRETLEAESMLLGRVTYEGFSTAWPERDGEFADKINAMPKHVATTTLRQLGWNSTPTGRRAAPDGVAGDGRRGLADIPGPAGERSPVTSRRPFGSPAGYAPGVALPATRIGPPSAALSSASWRSS